MEAVVTRLEDDPALNAGTGSVLDRRGEAVLDASIMDGEDLRVGGVAAVRTIRNPVRVARRVIDATRQVRLAGPGAEEFARQQGFEPIRPEELVVQREVERLREHQARRRAAAPGDTVGAVAIDSEGRIAAAGSTGGTLGKRPGRVGDTALPGAGLYADSRLGGVACTGWGEGIARLSMARAVLARIEAGQDPAAAARELLAACWSRLGGTAGLLIVTPDSHLVTAWSTPRMARGLGARRDGNPPPPLRKGYAAYLRSAECGFAPLARSDASRRLALRGRRSHQGNLLDCPLPGSRAPLAQWIEQQATNL